MWREKRDILSFFRLLYYDLVDIRWPNTVFAWALAVSASAQGFQQNKHAVNRPLSHGGHFESQENKKLCFCTSSLALDERLAVQNLLFQHCVIKVYLAALIRSHMSGLRPFESTIKQTTETMPSSHKTTIAAAMTANRITSLRL